MCHRLSFYIFIFLSVISVKYTYAAEAAAAAAPPKAKIEDKENKTEQEIKDKLKKICGLIVQVSIINGKASIEGSGSAFIINKKRNHINIMTAAHLFQEISKPQDKLSSTIRYLWFFIPDSAIKDSFNAHQKYDTMLNKLNGIDIETAEAYKRNMPLNIYIKEKAKFRSVGEKTVWTGRILSIADEQEIKKKIGSDFQDWLLLTKIIFPSFSRKQVGKPLWNGEDDVVLASGKSTWGQKPEKKEVVEEEKDEDVDKEEKDEDEDFDFDNMHFSFHHAKIKNQEKKKEEEKEEDINNINFEYPKDPFENVDSLGRAIMIKKFRNSRSLTSYVNSINKDKKFYSYGYTGFEIHRDIKGKFMQGSVSSLETGKNNSFLLKLFNSGPGSSGSLISTVDDDGILNIVGVISGDEDEEKVRATFLSKLPHYQSVR